VIGLDILGRVVTASPSVIAKLRDLAAAGAGRSLPQRDLSLALDRALRTQSTIVLQRGEVRALLELVEKESGDAEIAALAGAVRTAE
jgi:hypothetical protein